MTLNIHAKITAVVFLLLLLVSPLFDLLGPSGDTSALEKRGAVPAPEFDLSRAYLVSLSGWYAENFALRPHLIRLHNHLRWRYADESATTGVRKGEKGWLFYNKENSLDDYMNAMPLAGDDILLMIRNLEKRRVWLKERGIEFLVVAAPNKETVYSEFMPAGIPRLRPESRLDQLTATLRQHPQINFLDLRPAMLSAKNEARLYHRTDTHWNDYGAFIGAREILRRLSLTFPAIQPPSIADYEIHTHVGPGGDLAEMLALNDVITEKNIILSPRNGPQPQSASRPYANPVTTPGREMIIRETGNPALPRALIFRDSFASALAPFLSAGLQSSVYIWTFSFLPEIVEQEKPDVVILEFVERYIFALTVDDHPLPPLKAKPLP